MLLDCKKGVEKQTNKQKKSSYDTIKPLKISIIKILKPDNLVYLIYELYNAFVEILGEGNGHVLIML